MRRLLLWLALFVGVIAFGACASDEPTPAGLAEGCILNTDCAAPFVCAFRRCHRACNSSRDCHGGERCVVSDRPLHVCQLEDERNCSYTSECPGNEFCAIDLQCRDQCVTNTDCLKDQICISGTCADKEEFKDGGLTISLPEGGAEASSGQPCLYTSDCTPPLVCRALTCSSECLAAADCRAGYDCFDGRCRPKPGTVIGAAGGLVLGMAGKVELTIPPGSVTAPTLIMILPIEAWPAGALDPAFQIEPTGLVFVKSATLAYHFSTASLGAVDAAEVRLANATGTVWAPLESKIDVAASTISAELKHLSVYGLIGPPKKDAGSDASVSPPGCSMMACSGATADGCCPAACSATTDADCEGCGNGRVDPGETCDPVESCPGACPQAMCKLFTLAKGGTCEALCVSVGDQTKCVNTDGCCPAGCNTTNDSDCAASCGNGVVEAGELCDGNCPSKCAPAGCQKRTLAGSADTCNAHCVNSGVETACVADDACCPASCNATSDADCVPRCGNGIVEGTETCDGNCPTSCPAVGCQLRVVQGSRQSCDARCVDDVQQAACTNNDACCPAGCNTLNDNNCKVTCGNSVVEAGETCDPASACTTVQNGCVNDANTVVTTSGAAAACTFACTRRQRTCGPADTYCPSNVACGPTSDADCPGCGNGRVETGLGETCDPPGACSTQQTACVSDANNVRTSSGSTAACTYRCTTTARTCGPADGFCPSGCGPVQDVDCPGCGNGKIEGAETCDVAPAATTCASLTCNDGNACTTDVRSGTSAACNVTCAHNNVTACTNGDGCCPGGCNATNDNDCGVVCGNGVREGAETCEVAPATPLCTGINCNDGNACTVDTKNGANNTCNVTCTNATITACTNGDGCCPGGGLGACNANNDTDCTAVCGNGAKEGAETCDVAPASPVCSAISCDDGNACTADVQNGSNNSCDVVCSHNAITACNRTADGCCLAGCNANTDADCIAACGNAIVEPPTETCDKAIKGSCPGSCPPQGCVLPDLLNGGTCTARCVDQGKRQTQCSDGDGCCPTTCSDFDDTDCPTQNDTCDKALDISKGGDFPFSLLTAGNETSALCSTAGAEVFFTFTLKTGSAIYLDVYDPAGKPVNVALEVYNGACPAAGGKAMACDADTGRKVCGTQAVWPRIFQTKYDNGTYFVAARVTNNLPGRYKLRYQHVPAACLGAALPTTETGISCTQVDHYAAACAGSAGAQDKTWYIDKCPSTGLSVDTCSGRTVTDTILQMNQGTMVISNGACVPSTGSTVACNDDALCQGKPGSWSAIVNAGRSERGIFTVTLDNIKPDTCGGYGMNSATVP
ncbi:MAG TPA: hypothetical protein VJT73_12525 [Polyangiaceae bacterium]|nr:hypothetical protein [Polyangiaceae bacterium]